MRFPLPLHCDSRVGSDEPRILQDTVVTVIDGPEGGAGEFRHSGEEPRRPISDHQRSLESAKAYRQGYIDASSNYLAHPSIDLFPRYAQTAVPSFWKDFASEYPYTTAAAIGSFGTLTLIASSMITARVFRRFTQSPSVSSGLIATRTATGGISESLWTKRMDDLERRLVTHVQSADRNRKAEVETFRREILSSLTAHATAGTMVSIEDQVGELKEQFGTVKGLIEAANRDRRSELHAFRSEIMGEIQLRDAPVTLDDNQPEVLGEVAEPPRIPVSSQEPAQGHVAPTSEANKLDTASAARRLEDTPLHPKNASYDPYDLDIIDDHHVRDLKWQKGASQMTAGLRNVLDETLDLLGQIKTDHPYYDLLRWRPILDDLEAIARNARQGAKYLLEANPNHELYDQMADAEYASLWLLSARWKDQPTLEDLIASKAEPPFAISVVADDKWLNPPRGMMAIEYYLNEAEKWTRFLQDTLPKESEGWMMNEADVSCLKSKNLMDDAHARLKATVNDIDLYPATDIDELFAFHGSLRKRHEREFNADEQTATSFQAQPTSSTSGNSSTSALEEDDMAPFTTDARAEHPSYPAGTDAADIAYALENEAQKSMDLSGRRDTISDGPNHTSAEGAKSSSSPTSTSTTDSEVNESRGESTSASSHAENRETNAAQTSSDSSSEKPKIIPGLGIDDSGKWSLTLDEGGESQGAGWRSADVSYSTSSSHSKRGNGFIFSSSSSGYVVHSGVKVFVYPEFDVIRLDGHLWRCSRKGDEWVIAEKVAEAKNAGDWSGVYAKD